MTEMPVIIPRQDVDAIAELANQAFSRDAIHLSEHRVGFVLTGAQRLEQLDLEQYNDAPTRKTGHVELADADSFATYVSRHIDEQASTLWADPDEGSIVAVLNDHEQHGNDPGPPGWGDHRATLLLRATQDWKVWIAGDGKLMSQDAFAEFIEDGADAIREPSAAHMLEIAQNFHARSGASVRSGRRLTGEIQFAFETSTAASAGPGGNLEIPDTITLGLSPFEGGEPFAVTARFRFRLHEGTLSLGYRLIRPDRIKRAAFDDVVSRVSAAVDQPVMTGSPRA